MYEVIFIKPNGEEFITPLIHDDDLVFFDDDDALEFACDVLEYFEYIFNYYLDFVIERL